ncbi:hypothetical protein ABZS94_28910 [Streptomyces sp. NPDC005500]|uniref:hypothetical protein n=1 Tax=Streptomyces sp. NPDC005500 TaxID=3155007 RepID=UPI0033B78324
MFVSLKFWQVPESLPVGSLHLGPLARVASEITGKDYPPDEEIADGAVDSYRTVVEMVTMQNADTIAASRQDAVNEAFHQCLQVLTDVSSMARLVNGHQDPVVTREQIPLALWFGRSPTSSSYDTGLGGILTISAPVDPLSNTLDEQQVERLNAHLWRLWGGSPLELAMERSFEASLYLRRHGDYGNAVIHAALSSEIILDSTLGLMLWEEQLDSPNIDKAIAIFDDTRGGLASRVRREYGCRLGGTWDQTKPGPIQAWSRNLARLRGRTVHRGYQPSWQEAVDALAASDELLAFIKGRLAQKTKTYPRTALLTLGEPGLRRLGGWKAASAYMETQPVPDTWFREYAVWRARVDAAGT